MPEPIVVLAGGIESGSEQAWQLHTETWEWTRLPDLPMTNAASPALTVWACGVMASGGSVPCQGWHCGEQQTVETAGQWQVSVNATDIFAAQPGKAGPMRLAGGGRA